MKNNAPRSAKINKITLLGLSIITILTATALLAPWITPYDYAVQNPTNRKADPMTGYTIMTEQASNCHWYKTPLEWGCTIFLAGSDSLGRDILSRLVYSVRTSLIIGFSVAAISLAVGTTYGVASAYFHLHTKQLVRYFDDLMIVFIDFFGSFPPIIIMMIAILYLHNLKIIATAASIGNIQSWLLKTNEATNGIFFVIVVIGSTHWVQTAKLAKKVSISAFKNRSSYQLDSGAPSYAFTLRNTLHDIKKTIIMFVVMAIPSFIFTEVAFSFLGFGVLAPLPSFGSMLNETYSVLRAAPYYGLSTIFMLILTVIGFNLVTYDMQHSIKPLLPKQTQHSKPHESFQ